ncbi:MAG: LacI family transcriptional regulator [Microthrixaceae bacterium]|nr:LacI family transcriptional regulator [Microthrixaceae bacterium]
MQQLNYQPSAVARSLRTRVTHSVGLVVSDIELPFFATIARGAFKRASERDYIVLLAEDIEGQEADATYPGLIAAGRIDGLVIATARKGHPLLRGAREAQHAARLPEPHGEGHESQRDPGRRARDAAGGRLPRRPRPRPRRPAAAPRAGAPAPPRGTRAFQAHARKRGLESSPARSANLLQTGGAQAASDLLSDQPALTAIYTSSVTQAAGVLSFAWHHGISVPEQLSVISYADTPLAEALVPPLTAVTMPLEELGRAGVDMLLDELEGVEPHDVVIRDDLRIVERASTAAPEDSTGLS